MRGNRNGNRNRLEEFQKFIKSRNKEGRGPARETINEDDMYWCNYCKDYHSGVDRCGMRKQLDLGVFCSSCGSIVAEPGE